MSRNSSPLRYPGGKASLYGALSNIIQLNNMARFEYAEPYAGGCGLALELLFRGDVSDIHINDIDVGIWAFWECVLNHPTDLVAKIISTKVTIKEWHKQNEIFKSQNLNDVLSLGFSTFFLNRTNRSGILTGAGIIGGLKQDGTYKIDCRYNKSELIERILRIVKYKSRIHLTNLDALKFLNKAKTKLPSNTFFCIDPPYFNKGASLYTNFYIEEDHALLAKKIDQLEFPWIVTYDNALEIQKLYSKHDQYLFNIKYSAQIKKVGTEILVTSKGIKVPENFSGLSKAKSKGNQNGNSRLDRIIPIKQRRNPSSRLVA